MRARWSLRTFCLALAGLAPLLALAQPIPGFNPAPTAPGTVLSNEPYTATACFANNAVLPTNVGFQPTYQIVVPAGSALASASFLGNSQTVQTIGTCNIVAGCPTGFVNPDTGATVPLAYQQSLALVRISLGSFPPSLPPACISMGFNLGDPSAAPLGLTRNIVVTPIFSLGADPLDNPATDPPLVGTPVSLGVTPSLMTLAKTIAAPDGETATGPNFPRTFTLTLNVANGQTITNVDISDVIPGTLQYIAGSAAMTGCGGVVTNTSTPGVAPGGTLTRRCSTVTGTLGGSDLVLTFQAYVPLQDNGSPPVNVVTSAAPVRPIVNTGTADGTNAGLPVSAVSPPANIAAKLMTLRKTWALAVDPGANGVSPGDTLEYTLTFNLSDYFSVALAGPNALSLTDALGDGQTFLGCADVNTTVTAQANGTVLGVSSFPGATCAASPKVVTTGVTPITFDLRAVLSGTFGLVLHGDLANDGTLTAPTTVTVKFRATVDTAYSATPFTGGGTPQISLGDVVLNNATASGGVGGNVVSDPAATSIPVGVGSFTKSIYAYNGIVPPPVGFLLGPGDTLTYRITTSLPFASYENGTITDFLPLPFFDAVSIATAPVARPAGGAPPPSGTWTIGPSDTFTTVPTVTQDVSPTVSTSAPPNTILWNYGTYNTQTPNEVVDLLFTVTATTRPFGNSLNIANVAQSSYQNSTTVTSLAATTSNVTTKAPNVTIQKLIQLPNLDANCIAGPIPANFDSAVGNCDAGDQIDFRIVLTNAGRSPAYNARVDDNRGLPVAGFNSACTLQTVTDRAGVAVGSAGNLFDTTANGGLTIATIPANINGVVDDNEVVYVNYRCTIAAGIPSSLINTSNIDNTARLKYYSADPAQTIDPLYNFASNQSSPGPNVRRARAAVRGIQSIVKAITATSLTQTASTATTANVNNGETLTFLVTATLSEGTYANFLLTDTTTAIPTPITCGSNGFTCSANVTIAPNTPAAGQQTVTVAPTTASTPGVITYTYSSQKVASGTNIARVAATNAAQQSSPTVTWTLVNPNQTVSKAFSPATADAGDTVTVQLGWANSNAANSPMFRCVITDNLNAFSTILDLASVAPGVTPTNYTYSYVGGIVTYTYAPPIASPNQECNTGATGFATFTVQLLPTAATGGSITNTAGISVNTLPPAQAGGATRAATGTAVLTLRAPALNTKVIQATSEPDTAATNVAVGEIVTYRVTFNLPDGVTNAVTLVDEMQGGLVNFGYVGGSARLSRNTLNTTPTNTMTASADPGGINTAAQNAFVSVPVVCGNVGNPCAGAPNEIRVLMGSVVNNQQGAGTTESYTLELQLQALNVAANVANTTRTNRGRVIFTNAQGVVQTLNGGAINALVVAPSVQTTKAVSPATGIGGGDTVTYTLTITNPVATGSAPAFNWNFTDTLPADLQSPVLVSVVAPGGVTTTAAFTGSVLNGTISRLNAGQSVVVTYTAQIKPATPIGKTIINAASSQATTLPGPCGTSGNVAAPCAPLVVPATKLLGDPGTATGERTGSGVGANNLVAGANAPFTTNSLNVTKTIVSPQTFYAIGDVVQYQVSMVFPVGTATAVSLVDTLPVGLAFVSGSASTSVTGGPVTPTLPGVPPVQSGQDLTFNFGNVTATTVGTINVRYSAVVQNVITNQNNTPLVNNARVVLTNPNTGATITRTPPSLPTATVGEPALLLTKLILSGDPGADAGNTVRWSINVQNTGTTTAQRVDLKDVLPNGLFQISGVTVANPGGLVTLNGTATAVTAANVRVATTINTNDTIDVATLVPDGTDLIAVPPGAQITVAFDSVVMNTVFAGQTLTNVITAPYASQPTCLVNATCRDGSGAPLNDYVAGTSKALTIASNISIDKQVNQPTAPIGATVIFTSKVGVIEGVTQQVKFTDIFPAGLTPTSWSVAVGNMGMTLGNPSYATNLGTGQTVSFDFGDVSNPANGDPTDNFVQIDIVARVDNIATNQNGGVLSNGDPVADLNGASLVTVQWGAAQTTVTFDASSAAGIQGRPITVTEPELGVTKSVLPTAQALGDVVTYSVTVSHLGSSTTNAFGVAVTDTLPAGLTFVPGSVNPPGAFVSNAGQVLTLDVGTVLLGQNVNITYQARVDTSAVVGAPLVNSVLATWNSVPGATGAPNSGRTGSGVPPNDYRATASTPLTPTIAAFIDAQKRVAIAIDADSSGSLTPGDTLQYTVTLTNTGPAVTNAVFTDAIPVNTTYAAVPAPSTTAGTIVATTPVFTVNIGAMAAGQVVTIRFSATVNAGTPVGTVISNQGQIDSDQTVPTPTDADGIASNGNQPTEIIVGGGTPPPNAMYAQKFVALQADNDASGTITQGDRMRYTLAIQNTGGGTLTGVGLTDVIPAGLTYVAASASASAGTLTVVGSNVSWTGIGSLAPGALVTATFDVTITTVTGSSQTYVNQGTATSTQTGNVLTDSNGDPVDGNQPTVFTAAGSGGTPQPALDLQKRWSIAVDTPPVGVASPGDTLLYTVTVANNGSAPSANTRVTDPVPTCTGALNPCTAYVAGSLVTSQGAIVSTAPVDVNLGTLAPGATATISFRVLVNPATANGVVIANQAFATYTGGGPIPSDDNGNPADGLNPTLTPIATGAGAAGVPGNLAKLLAGTSEPSAISPGNAVLIGEVVRFQVSASMPPGTTRQVTYLDTLPAGLAYLPGSARLSRTVDTGLVASANPGNINTAPSGAFVPLVDGVGLSISAGGGGTTALSMFLGDVINSDNDPNLEVYTLEYRAVVRNDAGNQAGTALANAATVSFWNALSQTQTLTPVAVTLTVAEPVLALTKSASPASLLSTGGTTTFTLTLTNAAGANAAPAFDLALTDPLPGAFTSIGARTITSVGASGIVDTSTGTTVAATIARLDPGGSVTIVFAATAPGPLASGTLTNTASTAWTSLPGTNGSGADGVFTPGAPGSSTGERTGTGGVNDFAGSASAIIQVGSASITKVIVTPQPRYAIGDVVNYQVDLAMPIGTFGNALVTDVLPAGLAYVPGSLAIVYTGVSASSPPADFTLAANTPGPGETTLTAPFGTLTNASGGPGTVRLTYRAVVANVLSNQANTSLANSALLSFSDPGSGGATVSRGPATTSLIVGEPFLALTKALLSSPVGLAAGSTAGYTVTVGNAGTTTAFETVITDALPAGLFFPGGTVVTVTPTNLSGQLQVPNVTVNAAGWQSSAFDIPVGDSVVFSFTATLATTVQPGQVLQNGVAGTYTSRDGADPNERNGSSAGSNQSDDSALNNYNATALAPTITVADPIAIDKTFSPNPAQNRYTIGQLVTYRLKVSLLEGTTRSVRVTDALPGGLAFVSAGAPGIPAGAPITFSYSGSPTVAGQVITFDLGDVVVSPDGNPANDFITIDLTARVDNVITTQDGTVLGNNASVSFVNAAGTTVVRDFDADAGAAGVQPLNLTVIEPVVTLTKTAAPASVSLGDQVTFTLLLDHTAASRADANDVTVVDTLPAGLAYVPGSASLAPTVSGQTLTFNVGTLTLATDNLTITFRAQVSAGATVGVPLTNSATLTYASIPGATGAANSGRNGIGAPLNDYTATSTASVTPNANAQISALKTVAVVIDADGTGNLTPGDTVEWTIAMTNNGPAVTGVVFTDPIPVDTSYVTGSATTSAGTIGATATLVTATIGPMAANATVTVTFRTTVNAGVAAGTVLSNQGVVDSDQTVPTLTDNDADPSNGLNPTTIVVNGVPALSLVKSQSFPADTYPDGQLNPGEQIQYTLLVTSTGTAQAQNVVLTDAVPANTTLVSATTTVGTVTGLAPVTVNVGTLAVNATATIIITVQVNVGTPAGTVIANQGTVGATGVPSVPSNTVSAIVAPPPLLPTLAKAIAPATIFTGGSATLVLTLGNPNSIGLTLTAPLVDTLPAGMTTVGGSVGTCSGVTVTAATITKASGTAIPPGGCTIIVTVTSTTLGLVINVTGALQTNAGTAAPASAPLTVIAIPPVDLTIAKSHIGDFTQGQTGAAYLITVSNVGQAASSGTVTVSDTLPAGLTATSIAGSGWNCVQPAGPCARADALVPGGTFPAITLTVNVAANAATPQVNVAVVAGGGDTNNTNNTASDSTNIQPFAPTNPEGIPATSTITTAILACALALLGAGGLRRRGARKAVRAR